MNTPQFDPQQLLAQHAWVRSLAKSLVFDADRVDDVVQELWLQALRRPRVVDHPGGWLNVSIRHVAAQFGRSEARRRARELAVAKTEALPDDRRVAERAELHRDLLDHVLALDSHERTVLLMRFYDDLPPRAIAKRLGVPVGTVKSRLQRALAKLREDLDAEFGDRTTWGIALVPLATLGGPEVSHFALGRAASRLLDAPVKHALFAGVLVIVAGWFATSRWTSTDPSVEPTDVAAVVGGADDVGSDSASSGSLHADRAVALGAPTDSTDRSERTPVAVGAAVSGPTLTVLDSAGTPVVGARVQWVASDQPNAIQALMRTTPRRGEANTNEVGKVTLPKDGVYLVRVEPTGGLPTISSLDLAGARELRLASAGALEVRCVDERGRPIAGVELGVLFGDWLGQGEFASGGEATGEAGLRSRIADVFDSPPEHADVAALAFALRFPDLSPQRLQLEASSPDRVPRTVATGSDGRAVWPLLPASDLYHVRVSSKHRLESHQLGRNDGSPGRTPIESSATGRLDISGRFEIRAGETTELSLVFRDSASLRGRLRPDPWPWSEPPSLRVWLYVRQSEHQVSGNVAAQTVVGSDGSFEFDSVPIGEVQLRAEWTTQDGVLAFARLAATLASGDNDVGTFGPVPGEPVTITLGFAGPDGEQIDPGQCMVAPAKCRWRSSLRNRVTDSSCLGESVSLEFSLTPNVPIRVGGMEVGTWRGSPDLSEHVAWNEGWKEARPLDEAEFQIRPGGEVRLVVPVESVASIVVRSSSKDRPSPVSAYCKAFKRTAASWNAVGSFKQVTSAGSRQTLPYGDYDFVATAPISQAWPSGAWGRAQARVPGTPEVELVMEPGAVVSGFARRGAMAAQRDLVAAGLSPDGDPDGWASLWTTTRGADGSFRLGGLPPHSTIVFRLADDGATQAPRARSSVEVRTAGPGETVEVVLE